MKTETPVLAFIECDACRAKSGSPTLCAGCLHNRSAIERLHGTGRATPLSSKNEVVARARAARERTGHWPGSHAEALCAEAERLQRALDQRNEQIDGYEKQLGIDQAGAERTIGREIERLLHPETRAVTRDVSDEKDLARQWNDMMARSNDGLCQRAQQILADRKALCGNLSNVEDDLLRDLRARPAVKAAAATETRLPLADRLKALGYAPGGYSITCATCQQVANGCDKRAILCRDCALRIDAASPKTSECALTISKPAQ